MTGEPGRAAYRTWKDGINDRVVCVICGCERGIFDHSACFRIAANRGYFGSIFAAERESSPRSAPGEAGR